jgi:DNA repair photolyase
MVTAFPLLLNLQAADAPEGKALGPRRQPTLRDVGMAVRAGGVDALTDADLRADEARYQEVRCQSALNAVKGMPFKWTLNPYRGCTHACHYCFARRYHAQFDLNAGDEFATVILVKTNIASVLRQELSAPKWSREQIAFGTATDPYQPIEGHYKLTRACLEELARGRTPVGLVTKGPMVVRDIDVLREVNCASSCTVYMSVPTVDDDAWRVLEPGTAHPLQRLRAVRALSDAGVPAGVLMAPIVPGFSSSRDKLERTLKAIADHGARFVGANIMHLEGGTREHFMRFVQREFPHLGPRFERLYERKYAPNWYRAQVKAMVHALQSRVGGISGNGEVTDAREARTPPSLPAEAEQAAFRW